MSITSPETPGPWRIGSGVDEISRLLDEYNALAGSPRNKRLLEETWLKPNMAYMGDIGVPRHGMVPVIADPFPSVYARKMGISVADIYLDPKSYLKVWLNREIDRFTHIRDDRPLDKRVILMMGAAFEASLFGVRQVYNDMDDPAVERTPILKSPQDLARLEQPDFYKSGLMPLAHRFYGELSEIVKGHGLEVQFCDWGRGPFAVATPMRGMVELLTDMLERPEFVGRLLDFLTQAGIQYRKERAKFLQIPLDRPVFANDEVNVPSMSPSLYQNIVLPREKEYAAAFGGLVYWHSCGDVTPMIPMIREIQDITIFHVGPWTDLAKAAEVFGHVTLDICLHPLDIYQATKEQMSAKVRSIIQTCLSHGAHSFSIRPSILQAFKSEEEDLAAAARWVKVAKKTVAELTGMTGKDDFQ